MERLDMETRALRVPSLDAVRRDNEVTCLMAVEVQRNGADVVISAVHERWEKRRCRAHGGVGVG